jgi:hypothetical protein
MKYSKVQITSLGYELAPVVVTSTELEKAICLDLQEILHGL